MFPSEPVFVDTNILLRYLLDDQPEDTDRVERMLFDAANGNVKLWSHDTVFIEAAFVLKRRKDIPRSTIAEWFRAFISGTFLQLAGEGILEQTLDLYVRVPVLSVSDCYFAALSLNSSSKAIVSFDRGFDRVTGLKRIEPA